MHDNRNNSRAWDYVCTAFHCIGSVRFFCFINMRWPGDEKLKSALGANRTKHHGSCLVFWYVACATKSNGHGRLKRKISPNELTFSLLDLFTLCHFFSWPNRFYPHLPPPQKCSQYNFLAVQRRAVAGLRQDDSWTTLIFLRKYLMDPHSPKGYWNLKKRLDN